MVEQIGEAMLRLDKFLADCGFGTRKEVKELLRKKQVYVNDRLVVQPDYKVNPETDKVTAQGKPAGYEQYAYYMMNKPQGVVSATKDEKEKTVIQLIKEQKRRDLFPVGRLDKDTEGLLLITNDGKLANNLLAPGKHVEKTYYAEIDGKVTEREIRMFFSGLDIGDEKKTAPAELKILTSGERSKVEICITEGRYHQIKRMFEAVGMQVLYLKRLTMGALSLDPELNPGNYRKLTGLEIALLKENIQETINNSAKEC